MAIFANRKAEFQRKAGGVFYTPEHIADSIIQDSLGRMLRGRSPGDVADLRVLDMACGEGVFLLRAYRYLLDWYGEEYSRGESPRRLTAGEKAGILRRHIFGVDIDPRAAEFTRRALIHMASEDEARPARIDPGHNILCGNAIIAGDIGAGDFARRVNAFDWEIAFPGIMKAGGFSVILGNPPYVQLSMRDYFDDRVNEYLSEKYSSSMGRRNAFGYFIEKALRDLLKDGGYLGLVLPNTILTQEGYRDVRRMMLGETITRITTYNAPVFPDATVETTDIILRREKPDAERAIRVEHRTAKGGLRYARNIPQAVYREDETAAFLVMADEASLELRRRIARETKPLGELVHINQAIALKGDRSRSLHKEQHGANFFPVLDGREISRYGIEWSGRRLAYDREKIHSCKRTDIFESPAKILVRRTGERIIAALDTDRFYALNTLVVINPKAGAGEDLHYLLGLLNSDFLDFYFTTFLKSYKKAFSEIQARQLARLPIPVPETPAQKRLARRISSLVKNRLKASDREAPGLEKELEELILDLYGIRADERRLLKAPERTS